MRSEVKWTVLVGLVATLLATSLVALLTPPNILSLLGWATLLELMQLPMIAEARRGRLDPCTAWLRRVVGGNRGPA